MRSICDSILVFWSSSPNNPPLMVTRASQEINYETYRAPAALFLLLWECQAPLSCVILPTVCIRCDKHENSAIDGSINVQAYISLQINTLLHTSKMFVSIQRQINNSQWFTLCYSNCLVKIIFYCHWLQFAIICWTFINTPGLHISAARISSHLFLHKTSFSRLLFHSWNITLAYHMEGRVRDWRMSVL